jgi:cyclopentanol dehydrogenase
MKRVHGKVAIVTGAASGMGRSHAIELAREGASVVVTDVRAELAEIVANKIVQDGGKAVFQPLDVSKHDAWSAVIKKTLDSFGKLDVLVNNAGVYIYANAVDTTPEQWDHVFSVNARGTFLGCRAAIPAMKTAGGGSIINISSNFALVGRAGFSAYCASKAAIGGFTKAIAAELAVDKIRANSLHPGLIATEMTKDLIVDQASIDNLLGVALIRRVGQPVEISNAVIYLASDESAFMTGSEMVVDGGYVAV